MSPLRSQPTSRLSSRLVATGTLTAALAFAATAALATHSAASVTASDRPAAAPLAPGTSTVPPTAADTPAPPSSTAPSTARSTAAPHRPSPARPARHATARPAPATTATSRPATQRAARPAAPAARPAARPATRPATRSSSAAPAPAPAAGNCATATSAAGAAGAVLSAINSERAAAGLPALHMNSCLVSSAHAHNLAMARTGVLAHQLVGEADLATRLTDAGYHYAWAGENIAWSTDTSQQGVVATNQAMYSEKAPYDEHRQNILGSHYTDVGIDVYVAAGKAWLTEDFGGMA